MKFDMSFWAGVYKMVGRDTVKRMLTIPGGPLIAQAKRNSDDPAEIIAKRDAATEALLDLIEEYANFDND